VSRFRSLTARLAVTAIALVALVSVLIGVATTLVMRETLTHRLDDDVEAALGRALDGPPGPGGQRQIGLENQAPGTLIVVLGDDGAQGRVVGDRGGESDEVPEEVLDRLDRVDDDRGVDQLQLPRLGEYRVESSTVGDAVVLVGLPTRDVDEAVGTLLLVEVLLGLLAVVAAGGAATLVVRRQLRPLREVATTAHQVAELPLASGEVAVAERVPEHLTDEGTEVGQVGAALNTLLDHVESSLGARHRSEQQVRQFVADASHELRTPLATIQGYAELAQSRPDDVAAVRQAVARVGVEAARMSSLVEDLLLLARLDAGRPLDREPVDLTRLLLEAVTDSRVLAPDHVWRLELPEAPIEVVGDEQRLHQVVTNLLTNARKYTPPGTTVTVTADIRGFAVHDDGPGFSEDLRDRAFERFTRGDAARTREVGSSAGLGLALVKAIVTAHGGTVGLTSRPGDTRVRVDLPTPSE
jgi:two-component system OmpR family sensor kinase